MENKQSKEINRIEPNSHWGYSWTNNCKVQLYTEIFTGKNFEWKRVPRKIFDSITNLRESLSKEVK